MTQQDAAALIAQMIQEWTPAFRMPDDAARSFDEIGVKSFELLSLRAAMEYHLGAEIPDSVWSRLHSPRQLAEIMQTSRRSIASPTPAPDSSTIR